MFHDLLTHATRLLFIRTLLTAARIHNENGTIKRLKLLKSVCDSF